MVAEMLQTIVFCDFFAYAAVTFATDDSVPRITYNHATFAIEP
jgi:hypothetical protein